jgi:putative transposase
VLNRAVARLALFEKDADYEAFECVLEEAMEKHLTRLLSYLAMPDHWQMVFPNPFPKHRRILQGGTLAHAKDAVAPASRYDLDVRDTVR